MNKYIKILRFKDQPPQVVFALMPLLIATGNPAWIYQWVAAMFILSLNAFAINELVDREDVDKFSWNPIHIGTKEKLDKKIVWAIMIVLSVIGLWICAKIGLFWEGFAMNLIGILYSLKPFRFKSRYVLDVLAQFLVWGVIPFFSPMMKMGVLSQYWNLVLVLGLILWSAFYPYQLADMSADRKAKIRGTHVLLGMKNSLYLCFLMLVSGLVCYFYFGFHRSEVWSLFFLVSGIYTLAYYIYWMRLKKEKDQEKSMQEYAEMIKYVYWLAVPYLLIMKFV